ncbi:MAG: P-loop NTPase [Chloroflexota bacterium]
MANNKDIGRIVAVVGARGGVGTSVVASFIGMGFARMGKTVGILDADVNRPSIGRYFGIKPQETGCGSEMPVEAANRLKVMSSEILLPPDDRNIIRGGEEAVGIARRLWTGIDWGCLDYLVLDLPGETDVAFTMIETLPVSGLVLVFSPRETPEMVAARARGIMNATGVKLSGLVENYRMLKLPSSPKEIELIGIGEASIEALTRLQSPTAKYLPIFGQSKGDETARAVGVNLLDRIPYDPVLARFCDDGKITRYTYGSVLDLADGVGNAVGDETCQGCSACRGGGTCPLSS